MSKKEIKKITNDETYRVSMKRLADRPNSSSAQGRGGMSSAELKAYMDKYPELLKAKLDELIDLCNGASGENLLNLLHTSVTDDTTGEEKTLAEWIPEIVEYVGAIKGADGVGHFSQVDLENEPTEDNDAVTLAYFRDHSQSTDYVDKVISEAKKELDESKFSKSGDTITSEDHKASTTINGGLLELDRSGGGDETYKYAYLYLNEDEAGLRLDGSKFATTPYGNLNISSPYGGEIRLDSDGPLMLWAKDDITLQSINGDIHLENNLYGRDSRFFYVNVVASLTTNNATISNTVTAKTAEVEKIVGGDIRAKSNLTVDGNLEVKGSTFTVNSETLRVKDKIIEVGKDNTTTLIGYAGIAVPKYDGTNDGALVYDSTGTAYVGDAKINADGSISDVDMKPLVTRADTMTNGAYPVWDNATKSVKSGVIKSGSGKNALTFNSDNQAISENAVAFGSSNTAGLKGYKWSTIDFTNRTITLATAHTGGTAVNCEYAVGDEISINNDAQYPLRSTIEAVNGSVITVSDLPFNYVSTVAETAVNYVIYCPSKPTVGAIDLGAESIAIGLSNATGGDHGIAIGQGNTGIMSRSIMLGRNNKGGFLAPTLGDGNENHANYGIAIGKGNKIATAYVHGDSPSHIAAVGAHNNLWGTGSKAFGDDNEGFGYMYGHNNKEVNAGVVLGGWNNCGTTEEGLVIGFHNTTVNGAVDSIVIGHNNNMSYNTADLYPIMLGHHLGTIGGAGVALTLGKYVAYDKEVEANGAARVTGGGKAGSGNGKNIEILDWEGNLKLAGGLTVGKAPSKDMDAATKKYVDDKLSSTPTFKTMSQAQYDALSVKDANTLYLIVG